MLIKTSELTGAALDWATLKAEGVEFTDFNLAYMDAYQRSSDWAQGGPIIEREGIDTWCSLLGQPDHADPAWRVSHWSATCVFNKHPVKIYGPTPLIAAMRCYVMSKLSDEVEVPDELC